MRAISSETIEQFLQRRGPVFTNDVACRFGMQVKDARRALKLLERDGRVRSRRDIAGGNGAFTGAGLLWEAGNG